jgi:hypothetical protein
VSDIHRPLDAIRKTHHDLHQVAINWLLQYCNRLIASIGSRLWRGEISTRRFPAPGDPRR